MLRKGTLAVMIFTSLFMASGPVSAGLEEKVSGDFMVFKNDLWLHRFSFEAQETGDEPFGTGFMTHQRLNSNDYSVRREEHIEILYVIVAGNEAWFTGPIVYDSNDPDPTRWFVVYVQDNDLPGAGDGSDLVWFDRVADENEALNLLKSYSWGDYPPDDLESGDIKIYNNPNWLSTIFMLLL